LFKPGWVDNSRFGISGVNVRVLALSASGQTKD
jgi:hypothetical protein